MPRPLQRLITRDPASGEELIVTRLESPATGVSIEGRFSLGWIGKLTPEQLDFVGVFMRARGNLQRVADDFGVAYNTAKARLDEVDEALGEPSFDQPGERQEILERLAAREIDFDTAMELLERSSKRSGREGLNPPADRLDELPVAGALSSEQVEALRQSALDVDTVLSLPVDGPFTPEQLVQLAGCDLSALAEALHRAPVDGPFTPEQVVALAQVDPKEQKAGSKGFEGPVSPQEYVQALTS